jgi:hypothetical protein
MFTHLWRSRTLRTLAGAGLLALAGPAGPARPADPPVKTVAFSDVAISNAVLAAIDADAELKGVNLVVSVVDRGAVIGGPVLTDEVKARAERVVRAVPGVASVKNLCFVQPAPDALVRAVAEGLKPAAKPTTAALPGVALPPTAPDGFLPPLAPLPPSDLIVGAPKPVEALRPTASGVPPVNVLGGPVAVPGTAAVPQVKPLPTSAPPPAVVKPLFPTAPVALGAAPAYPDVPTAVAALRKEARFARLDVKTTATGLLVVGAAQPADVWEYIAELRKVPGVARVEPDPQLVK